MLQAPPISTTASQRSTNVPRVEFDPTFDDLHEIFARRTIVVGPARVLPGNPGGDDVIAGRQAVETSPEATHSRIAGADGEVVLPVRSSLRLDRADVIEPDLHRDHSTDELLRVSDLHHEFGVGLAEDVRLLVVRAVLPGDVVPDRTVVVDEELGVARLAIRSHVGVVGPVGGRPRVDVGSTAAGEGGKGGDGQNGQDVNEQCAFHRILLRLQFPLVAE